ncbi:hypothetical protein [Staphylococcus caprae]|uniref:hypothetical protein n=1 Tax=Staphylococcus caprae TaxID=29380 RepID=UPI000E0ED7D2|nr:hypothetical protein [Staphylococcus caprae]
MIKEHIRKIVYVLKESSEEELREIGLSQPEISRIKEDYHNSLDINMSPATMLSLYHKIF